MNRKAVVPRFKFTKLLIVFVLYGLTLRPVSAGTIGDCGRPRLVQDAAVNTILLGYRYEGRNTSLRAASARVSVLTQLDGLFSQLKYNSSIAVVRLFRPAGGDSSIDDPCPPDVIVDQLIPQLAPNHALVVLWGNLVEDGGSMFIQSFAEIRRASQNDDVVFSWRRNDQDYWFSAGLPVNLVAFPPHKVPQSAIQELSAAYESMAATYEEPNSSSRSTPLKARPEEDHPYSYFVDQVQGSWMHLRYNNEPIGWVNSGDLGREWPVRKYLPELDFIDGAVGYLLLQDDREHQNPLQVQSAAFADGALRRFIEATTDEEGGAPALALAKSMEGIIEFRRSSMRHTTPELRKIFEKVVKLVPFSSQARNLRAMVDLKACCSNGSDDLAVQNVKNQLIDAVRVEPQDDRSLNNLENLYSALGSPNAKKVHEVREALNSGGKATNTSTIVAKNDPERRSTSQAALRMRTLSWYDLKWSKTTVNVNEEYEITGKLHIMDAWPAAIPVPDRAFLNVGQPGAMVKRLGVWLGGQFTPRSMKLELGKTYEFRMPLRARRPGHWCVHVQLNIENGDPIPGPCQYIDIKGDFADFTDDIKLLNGTMIDLEQYGIGKIYLWHLFWFIAGCAWFWYWFSKRGFVRRFLWVATGKAEEVITPQERVVGAITVVAVLLVVIIFYAITASNYPNTIPLQAGDFQAIDELPSPLKIKYLNGTYKVPGRELVANFKVTNTGKEALRIGEFNTAGLRFLNPDVYTAKVEYPDYLLAERGLSLSDPSPIQPGETRDVTVTIQDARWDTERLSGLAYDVDSSFAGMLFFFTPNGERYPVEVSGPVIPTFLPV